ADGFSQFQHLARAVAIVHRGDDHDGALESFEVALELGLEVVVEHGNSLGEAMRKRIGTDAGWLAGGRGGEGIHPLAGPASAPIRSRAVAWDGTGRGASRSGRGTRMRSDLADQVQRRLQGLLAF